MLQKTSHTSEAPSPETMPASGGTRPPSLKSHSPFSPQFPPISPREVGGYPSGIMQRRLAVLCFGVGVWLGPGGEKERRARRLPRHTCVGTLVSCYTTVLQIDVAPQMHHLRKQCRHLAHGLANRPVLCWSLHGPRRGTSTLNPISLHVNNLRLLRHQRAFNWLRSPTTPGAEKIARQELLHTGVGGALRPTTQLVKTRAVGHWGRASGLSVHHCSRWWRGHCGRDSGGGGSERWERFRWRRARIPVDMISIAGVFWWRSHFVKMGRIDAKVKIIPQPQNGIIPELRSAARGDSGSLHHLSRRWLLQHLSAGAVVLSTVLIFLSLF